MMQHKIKDLYELAQIIRQLQQEGKTVAQCHGTFDLMHPGHIYHFEAAKREADVLVVTVTPDRFVRKGIGRPVFNEKLRMESIAALACVDYVALDVDAKPLNAIELLKPDVFVKGGDYTGKEFEVGHAAWEEKQITDAYGGRYHHTNEPVVFSSTTLLNEHFSPYPPETQEFLRSLRAKHSAEYVAGLVERMRGVRILVIGDTILDVYHYCLMLGRSVKEEIPRVRVTESEMFAGGSIAVANTVAGFCDRVGLLTVLGRKELEKETRHEAFIREKLISNVHPHFFYRDDAPTVVNERYADKAFLKKYFGLYQIEDKLIREDLEEKLISSLPAILSQYDVVLVMDYGLGMLTPRIIKALGELAPFLVVNTQTNSANVGYNYITKYPRADYFSISEPELRLAFQAQHTPLPRLLEVAARHLSSRVVSLTLANRGALLSDGKTHYTIPVFSQKVVDRIGAGDAYLAVTAPCIYFGDVSPELTGFIGNVAGAIACTIVANRESVNRDMLMRSVQMLLK